MIREKFKGFIVRRHLDTSTVSRSKGGCRWSIQVTLRGVKKYYPIEPALYMDPQYWRAQVNPETGRETREKVIVHVKGNANSRAMERAIMAKEEEMRDLIAGLMDKGETPDHGTILRLWARGATATFADCVQRYMEVRAGGWRGGLKGSTAQAARDRLSYAIRFTGDTPLSALNVDWARRLHNWLLNEAQPISRKLARPGLSQNFVTTAMFTVGAVLSLAVEEGHIRENVVAAYKKSKATIPMRLNSGKSNPLSEEEVERLQAAWEGMEVEGRHRETLQQALISIYTGFRVSDLAQLGDPTKFILEGKHLQVVSVKTARPLKVLVTQRLAGVLSGQSGGSLLLRPINHRAPQSGYLRNLLKVLGMERRGIVWHDLRKTFVNIMYARTGDLSAVSKAVGHTSVAVTEGHYLKSSSDHIDRVMSSFDTFGTSKPQVSALEVLQEVAGMVAANPSMRVTPRMAELLRTFCGMEVGGQLRAV
jgi:integrase